MRPSARCLLPLLALRLMACPQNYRARLQAGNSSYFPPAGLSGLTQGKTGLSSHFWPTQSPQQVQAIWWVRWSPPVWLISPSRTTRSALIHNEKLWTIHDLMYVLPGDSLRRSAISFPH